MICFRLLDSDDPAEPLAQAVAKVCEGENPPSVYSVNPTSFRQVPNGPFAYWVSERIFELFRKLEPFVNDDREAWMGLSSGHDFQWLRLMWEVKEDNQCRSRNDSETCPWIPISKGGEYATFYPNIHLLVDWSNDGKRLSEWKSAELLMGRITANNSKCWNQTKYFRRGITWSRRSSKGLSVRMLPKGIIFGDKGPGAFAANDNMAELATISALFNSSAYQGLVALQLAAADTAARSYEVGIIQRTVIPTFDQESSSSLGAFGKDAWSTKRSTDTANQTSHAFYAPALTPKRTKPLSTHST
jgi:hypothetical protein